MSFPVGGLFHCAITRANNKKLYFFLHELIAFNEKEKLRRQ
jgi:hypothetical protein